MKKHHIYFIIALFGLGAINSCKKDRVMAPRDCLLKSVINEYHSYSTPEVGYDTTLYTYDANYRLLSIDYTNGTPSLSGHWAFTYTGNSIVRLERAGSNPEILRKDSMIIGANGLIAEQYMYYNLDSAAFETTLYQYNSDGLMTDYYQHNPSGDWHYYTTIEHGDIVSINLEGYPYSTKDFYYDVNQPVAYADINYLQDFGYYGASTLKSTHRLTGITSSFEDTYTYEFNGQGNVSKITTRDEYDDVYISYITYECH